MEENNVATGGWLDRYFSISLSPEFSHLSHEVGTSETLKMLRILLITLKELRLKDYESLEKPREDAT
jgi:hypothetical protein